MKARRLVLTAVALMFGVAAFADEGMWMIQDINEALEKNMRARGLRLAANEIYNDEAPGTAVADAVVSIGFYCTGSVISDQGLIITNHHCAYSNIAKLSTPEHNYLEDGFWAMTSEQEIPVEGEKVFFLKRVQQGHGTGVHPELHVGRRKVLYVRLQGLYRPQARRRSSAEHRLLRRESRQLDLASPQL